VPGIVVTVVQRTTDDEVQNKLDRAHHAQSLVCPTPPHRLLLGRLWRMEFGKPTYLLRKGETGQGKPSPWPPWLDQ
jgi:hypothetical protein